MSIETEKVVSTQENLCQAIEIIASKVLSGLEFDITETATIIDDSKKAQGQYRVRTTTGDAEYDAYTSDTTLTKNTIVYVTIPKGNYSEQKMIVCKKTSETEKPINVTNSFDNLVEMVNIEKFETFSLLANGKDKSINIQNDSPTITNTENALNLKGYSRFGIKANFRSWISEAITGDYGLKFILYSKTDTTIEDGKEIIKYQPYEEKLDISKMFGNPYNFDGYYSQEWVFDISGLNNIDFIYLEFYQDGNFKDKNNSLLPTTMNDNEDLPDNLFVKDIQLSIGYDISEIKEEFVQLYSLDNSSYTGNTNDIKKDNKKEIKLRWVHMLETFGALDIADAKQLITQIQESELINENDSIQEENKSVTKEDALIDIYNNSTIEWFKYKLGAPSATPYSGVYWEKLDNDNSFNYILYPDINLAEEQLKVIVTYPKDSTTRYISNIITFNNEKDVSGINAGKYLSALTIRCDDDSYGNYFIYDQGYGLLDQSQSKEIKTITAHFDLEKMGDEIDSELTEAETISWTIPATNTMINVVDEGYNTKEYRGISEVNDDGNYVEKKENGDIIFTITSENDIDTWTYTDNICPIRNVDKKTKIGEEKFTLNNQNYKRIIKFSTYEIKDNKLKTEIAKVSIYKQNDEQPVRIYDNVNKIVIIYEYNLTSIDNPKRNQLQYRINSTYSPSNNNNTIQCSIVKDGTKYSTSKELSFGIAGTADTDFTLVLDFDDNKHALTIGDNTVTSLTLRLYGQDGKEIIDFTENKNITWSLYSGSFETDIKFMTGTQVTNNNKIISYTAKQFMEIQQGSSISSNSIIIVQASIDWADRDLIAYLPIPITNNSNWDYIKGATRLIYLSDGSIDYDKQSYEVFTIDKEKITNINRSIINNGVNNADKYAPTIDKNTQGIKPINIYIDPEKARYAVKLSEGTNYWTNPILILQNRYPSAGINNWDGETLVLDDEKSSIYSSFIAAGKKNEDGKFSGVVLGEAKESIEKSMKQTGLYGFHNGTMSYAFKEDGTAFIGKSGGGRIEFDGSNATIQSSSWRTQAGKGMKIDLNDGQILINTTSNLYPLNINNNFKVNTNGVLEASGVNISGTIYANSGVIGDWILQNGTLVGADSSYICGGVIEGASINTNKIYYTGITGFAYQEYINNSTNPYDENWAPTRQFVFKSQFTHNGKYGDKDCYKDDNRGLMYVLEGEVKAEDQVGEFGEINGNFDNKKTVLLGIKTDNDSGIGIGLETYSNIGIKSLASNLYLVASEGKISLQAETIEFLDEDGNDYPIYARFA